MGMGADIASTGNVGKVVGAKLTRNEILQINGLVDAGLYLNPSDFIRDAVREKLAAVKVIEYRDADYQTAKVEVAGYFQMKGEAYASDASTDPQLDYELVCEIMDDLEKEGKIGKLYNVFYTTVGNGTAVGNSKKWGGEIGRKLRDANVQAVILTST